MDNASDYGSEDSRFESWQARIFSSFVMYKAPISSVLVAAIPCHTVGLFSELYIAYKRMIVLVTQPHFTLYIIAGKLKTLLHRPGIEPGPPAWQASILPLNQRCSIAVCSCGRVVKATDSKSVSLWERRFEFYRLRKSTFFSQRLDLHGNQKAVERTLVNMSASLVQW